MEQKQEVCPHCGGTKLVAGVQQQQGRVWPYPARGLNLGQELIHIICKSCGTVVRSYVDYPEDLKDFK
ncbi:hypothetical protein D1641_08555 [Colidextribacter sp. OB.20]|uniref:hypothetical protein n=1 Tax=Colidextribacter sp. OB.20 TaxID=2304568 RepID=UPI0013689875|nr:hypothetical protein [Colidextribacter sp. OB.20]NBI10069.1 hypothetical protein [Colidextribacter sp. OB.20]